MIRVTSRLARLGSRRGARSGLSGTERQLNGRVMPAQVRILPSPPIPTALREYLRFAMTIFPARRAIRERGRRQLPGCNYRCLTRRHMRFWPSVPIYRVPRNNFSFTGIMPQDQVGLLAIVMHHAPQERAGDPPPGIISAASVRCSQRVSVGSPVRRLSETGQGSKAEFSQRAPAPGWGDLQGGRSGEVPGVAYRGPSDSSMVGLCLRRFESCPLRPAGLFLLSVKSVSLGRSRVLGRQRHTGVS
jgi:hypothetical protein